MRKSCEAFADELELKATPMRYDSAVYLDLMRNKWKKDC